jgi:hypothetical protein
VQRRAASDDRAEDHADRTVRRRSLSELSPAELDPGADDGTPAVLSEAAMDAIVVMLEARLIESIERRGGFWRGGF